MPLCHLKIIFGEMSVQVLGHFLIGLSTFANLFLFFIIFTTNQLVRDYNDFFQMLNIVPRATGIWVFLAFNILNLNPNFFALCPENAEETCHQNCLE